MNPNVQLPRSSRQETLETISRNRLALLFDPELFELRPEDRRDKGVDIIGEIKQDGVYTNFRFAMQVKSTAAAKKQPDGSISYPIEISNLQYLLNLGLPGFYVLHDHPSNLFYMASVADVYRSLSKKYTPDKLPKSYMMKFTGILDQQQLDRIYKETFENGTLLKKLGAHMRFQTGNDQAVTGIVIDERQEVYSVEQNMAFIDAFGYQLLNQHAFSQVAEIEQRTHPRGKASATFNMVCGAAYLHQGNLLKAVELLKLAHQEIDNLHPQDRTMLCYELAHAKYLLGLLSEADFKKETSNIVANENAGTFLLLEDLYNQFVMDKEVDQGLKLNKFYDGAIRIANKHPEFHDMRVVAYAKILHAEATLLLNELAKNCLLTLGRKMDTFRDQLNDDWLKFDEQFLSQLQELFGYALKHRNFAALSNLMMEKIEWEFAKIYHFHAICNWNKETLSIDLTVAPDDRELLLHFLADIHKVTNDYERSERRENLFNCLLRKYEILDFLGNNDEAAQVAEEMKTLIATYELNALRPRMERMLQGEMRHRSFLKDLSQRRAAVDRVAKGAGWYQHLYGDMNEEVNRRLGRKPAWSLAELLPLAYPVEDMQSQ